MSAIHGAIRHDPNEPVVNAKAAARCVLLLAETDDPVDSSLHHLGFLVLYHALELFLPLTRDVEGESMGSTRSDRG